MEDRRWQKPIVGNLRHLTAIWKAGVKVVFIRACASIFMEWGAKIVLCLVSHGGASMVDAGREDFIFLFCRTQENVFLDTFSKNFVFVPQMFFVGPRNGGKAWPIHRKVDGPCLPPVARAMFISLALMFFQNNLQPATVASQFWKMIMMITIFSYVVHVFVIKKCFWPSIEWYFFFFSILLSKLS